MIVESNDKCVHPSDPSNSCPSWMCLTRVLEADKRLDDYIRVENRKTNEVKDFSSCRDLALFLGLEYNQLINRLSVVSIDDWDLHIRSYNIASDKKEDKKPKLALARKGRAKDKKPRKKRIPVARPSKMIKVVNVDTNESFIFENAKEAATFVKCPSHTNIYLAINRNPPSYKRFMIYEYKEGK